MVNDSLSLPNVVAPSAGAEMNKIIHKLDVQWRIIHTSNDHFTVVHLAHPQAFIRAEELQSLNEHCNKEAKKPLKLRKDYQLCSVLQRIRDEKHRRAFSRASTPQNIFNEERKTSQTPNVGVYAVVHSGSLAVINFLCKLSMHKYSSHVDIVFSSISKFLEQNGITMLDVTEQQLASVNARAELDNLLKQVSMLGMHELPPSKQTTFNMETCRIPKVIHQTWKTSKVPDDMANYSASWTKVNPGYDYHLWTDRDNLALVRRHFPQYYKMFVSLNQNIMRADLIRYFILWKYGGVYVDLDFEALQPLDTLFDTMGEPRCLIGVEPELHAHLLHHLKRLACNALMMSCPGHPFWKIVIDMAVNRFKSQKYTNDVMRQSGPLLLNDAIDLVSKDTGDQPVLADPVTFYPKIDLNNKVFHEACRRGEMKEYREKYGHDNKTKWKWDYRVQSCKRLKQLKYRNPPIDNRSWAVHHWSHEKTWAKKNSILDEYEALGIDWDRRMMESPECKNFCPLYVQRQVHVLGSKLNLVGVDDLW
eukprot:gnl/MRDRNA2_/MRDRNA2_85877_c0_seq2.p1 gnl/MRDRNA2_/MRDRNA2_85877_c0~~gnl/MRDRNA2_/MRDRNA2_85877_c0_seq2.p1  ORF type:complete len:600 (+),score=106.15 gnl/MRDRNA2_/MRDRNA2_85877_c0_seq2:205-1800(+)